MKRIVLNIVVVSLLIFANVNAAFCCRDHDNPDQEKCYDDGECCDGIWYTACNDFEISVAGTSVFRIGQKTPVVVYIENIGAYTDSYMIDGVSDNPLIILDMTGATQITNVGPGEIKKVYPRITVLASTVTGTVTFTGIPWSGGDSKSADLTILESESYLSLPEFSSLGFIELLLSIGIIYFISRQRY